jgi:hypothetical protein
MKLAARPTSRAEAAFVPDIDLYAGGLHGQAAESEETQSQGAPI